MRLPFSFAVLAFLSLSCLGISPASAHTIVLKNWCGANSSPHVFQQFNFTGEQLRTLVDQTIASIQLMNDAEDAGSPPPTNDGKCGIVDVELLTDSALRASTLRSSDEWTQATVAITFYCNQFQAAGYDVPMPYITSASSAGYVSTTHHTTYHISSGLKGSCVACPLAQAP